jgi:hypothetical protein
MRLAHSLRPLGEARVSILEIAHRAGVSVWLRLHTGYSSPSAQIDLVHRPPKIILYRQGKLNGERRIEDGEDGLLTAREKFSVAHELGHWIALSRLKVHPQSSKGRYWVDEEAMNAFAGCLLTPDWLVSEWLRRTPEGHPISPLDLETWARAQCGVSQEVIAKALTRRRDSIGFLKVSAGRNADGIEVLKVVYSAAGRAVSLPYRSTHIHEPRLLERIKAKTSGSVAMVDARLGRSEFPNLHLSWRRIKNARGTAWLCLSLPAECTTCEGRIFGKRPHFDDTLPFGVFCSRECILEALLAVGAGAGYRSEERFKDHEPDPV